MAKRHRIRLLKICMSELSRCQRRFERSKSLPEHIEGQDAILLSALRCGVDTIRAVRMLLKSDLNAPACGTARAFVETSIRLLWAARAPDGWVRYQGWIAGDQIKWAKSCVSDFGHAREEFAVLSDDEVRRLEAIRPRMPIGMYELLKQITDADRGTPFDAGSFSARQRYVGTFGFLHRAAHGNPIATANADLHFEVDLVLASAAADTIRAICLEMRWDEAAMLFPTLRALDRRCVSEGMRLPPQ